MTLNTLQNFYKAIVTDAWESGTGNRYVSVLPTPTSGRLVVNPSNATKREIVEYSAVGTDGGGNYVTLSARGVGGTTDQDHDINEPVRMNLTAEDFADVQTEIDGVDTNLQTQIDSLVATRSVPATTSALGISKLSVAAVESGTPVVVGDNDPRVNATDAPSAYVDESAGAADAGKGILLNSQGVLSGSILNFYGDGSDGDVTISSPTTLTSDKYYNNLTLNSTLSTNGWKVYVKGTLSGSGSFEYNGNNGNNGADGANDGGVGGAGGTAITTNAGYLKNNAGGVGSNGGGAGVNNPSAAGATTANTGNLGGVGGAGVGGYGASTGGTVTVNSFTSPTQSIARLDNMFEYVSTGIPKIRIASSGSGGGASKGALYYSAGSGGGGGASGGIIWVAANIIAGTWTFSSTGGNGGNGGNGVENSNGGSGGGGGAGGTIYFIYSSSTWTGSATVTGGTGGSAGTNGGGSGMSGNAGANGGLGELVQISTLI